MSTRSKQAKKDITLAIRSHRGEVEQKHVVEGMCFIGLCVSVIAATIGISRADKAALVTCHLHDWAVTARQRATEIDIPSLFPTTLSKYTTQDSILSFFLIWSISDTSQSELRSRLKWYVPRVYQSLLDLTSSSQGKRKKSSRKPQGPRKVSSAALVCA